MLQARSGRGYLSKQSLAIFDKFCADQKGDPRSHVLKDSKLEDLVAELKAKEPWLTTTRAIPTSADRLDGTAANIMEAYYLSIDDLHEAYPLLDQEPSRTMNFDEVINFIYVYHSLSVFSRLD